MLWLAAILATNPTAALEIEFSGRPVKRDILALYDSRRERKPHETRIHKFAEMPLNYLGYRVVYHDVNTALPDPTSLDRYRGILTWLIEPMRKPEALLDWLDDATTRGLKLVILGEVAPPEAAWLLGKMNRVLSRIGLESTGDYVDLTWRSTVVDKNPDIVGFERPLDKTLPGYSVVRAKSAGVEPHLVVDHPGPGGTRVQATLIATSNGGGYASQGFTVFYEQNTDRVVWTLNPFAFFRRSFGAERFPIPDTTTLSGRRIYFSHIDGDGWNNMSEIEGHREVQRFSAEVIAREAIVPYPDLPVTIGLIAGDVTLELGGNPAGRTVARQLYALPNVEVGSHTYTHPYNWQFFETYDRATEVAKVESYQPPDLSARERLTRGVLKLSKKELPADRSDRYVAGSDDLPRTYLKKPFDLDLEIRGSLKVAEGLAPAGKPAKAYLWSGDTTPFPGALRAVRLAGAFNINGGDSRLDREYPSVAYVPPISRQAGQERQIYAGNSNENTYTNDWTGPYYGFFLLEETLRNTDAPRRLKPFNLYYHMYSGEKASAVASVRHFLELARKSPVFPVPASRYSALAGDFFTTEIEQVDLFSWSINNRGRLQTVRLDSADELEVDLLRSNGALGSNRHQGALYVTLDPAVERAVVTLRPKSTAPTSTGRPQPLHLLESRWELSSVRRDGCNLDAKAQGFGPGEMAWRMAGRKSLSVTVTAAGDDTPSTLTSSAGPDGVIRFSLSANAIEPVNLRIVCHD